MLDTEACRRMSAGAESATWIDHDGDHSVGWLLPRRADPQASDVRWAMEFFPAFVPVGSDLTSHDCAEIRSRPALSGRVGIPRELNVRPAVGLLEALREQHQHARSRRLRLAARYTHGDPPNAAQWNMLFSFS